MNVNHIYGNLSQYHAYQNSEHSFNNLGNRRFSGPEANGSRPNSQMEHPRPNPAQNLPSNGQYSPNLNLNRQVQQQSSLNLSRTIVGQQRQLTLHDSHISGGIETEPALSKPEGFNYFRKAQAQASPVKSSAPVLFGQGYPPRPSNTQNTSGLGLASTPNLNLDGQKPANSYLQFENRQARPVSVTLASHRQAAASPTPNPNHPQAALPPPQPLSSSILSSSHLHTSQMSHPSQHSQYSHTPTRIARYSPLQHRYDDDRSKSPSVISHQNTAINETLRSKLDVDAETDRLQRDYTHLVAENERKVLLFVTALDARVLSLGSAPVSSVSGVSGMSGVSGVSSGTSNIGELVQMSEMRNLDIDAVFFREKGRVYEEWVGRLRKQIEDRELVYRSLYKLAANPRSLEMYLGKKQAEIEADNRRERNHYERRVEMLEAELKALELEIAKAEAEQRECDEQWLRDEHAQRVAWEAKAREQMNETGYDLVVRYFLHYGKEDSQCNRLASQMAELARHRKEYKEKLEEARIIADPAKLQQEITRMENLLRQRRM